MILTNGARLYVDHAHPEYSSPEVTNPLDAVRWDHAGERVMLRRARALAVDRRRCRTSTLYKNNMDDKGASYGIARELPRRRAVPFARHRPRG